jgi:uncharacterized iron-regulated membrane protein
VTRAEFGRRALLAGFAWKYQAPRPPSRTLKKLTRQLHLWFGLPAAAVLVIVALTGAILVYERDLDRAWNPELWRTTAGVAQSLDTLAATARATAPDCELKQVRLTTAAGRPVEFRFTRGRQIHLDPVSGAVLGARSREGSFFGTVEKIHTSLVAGEIGRWIVGLSSVALLALLATGLVLWWPKQLRMLKGAVSLALDRKGRALHLDLHNTLGFWTALPLLLIGFTGTIIAFKPLGNTLRTLGRDSARPEIPAATSAASLPDASLDTLAAAARAAFPAAREFRLIPSPTPKARMSAAPAKSSVKSRIDHSPSKIPLSTVWRVEAIAATTAHDHARSAAWFDPRSAALLGQVNFSDLPIGERLRALVRPIHDGSVLGRPTQLIALLAVLVLPLLSVTGVALWWLRHRAQRCGKYVLLPVSSGLLRYRRPHRALFAAVCLMGGVWYLGPRHPLSVISLRPVTAMKPPSRDDLRFVVGAVLALAVFGALILGIHLSL